MALLGIDLGGTKLASAIFKSDGSLVLKNSVPLENRAGVEVGKLVTDLIRMHVETTEANGSHIDSIGIAVPGISNMQTGNVWAPNIKGWSEYPLLAEVRNNTGDIPVIIDSDRTCYILGEVWAGNARGCKDAIFLAVGTGIGAGILVNGEVMRGSNDIAGAIGWMALNRPFDVKYTECGCFEYHASGEGIAGITREFLRKNPNYTGSLRDKKIERISALDLFTAFEAGDLLAAEVIEHSIEFWGMAVANLVSLFNPEKIILGGGVFGPAVKLIPAIMKEAVRWAQPVSISQMTLEASSLGGDAGLFGAGYLALRNINGLNLTKS